MSENEERKVIDEANYNVKVPKPYGPTAVGKGGDPLFRNIRATKEELVELLDETTTVQDWIQRETCNNVALKCLTDENLKEIYFKIKDGFGEFGPILLMGFKTPLGVEIPRLKILNADGEVLEVLTGPLALEELNKRALAFQALQDDILPVIDEVVEEACEIQDYSGNPNDYV